MGEESLKIETHLSSMSRQTEIVQAELRVTKYVATFTGETSIAIGIPTEVKQQEGSAGLQSQLVDGAISHLSSNLPAEVLRVTQLQRHQGSHIAALHHDLTLLQEQKRKVMARCVEVREDLEMIRRQTYLHEEECSRKNKHCVHMKNEILALVKEGENKRRRLASKTSELQALKMQLGKYRQRLDDYSTTISNTSTGDSKAQTDIQHVKDRLHKLQEKKSFLQQNPSEAERVVQGTAERELRQAIALVITQSDEQQDEVKRLQEKMESIRAKQEKVKQATTVLKKRNAAQLTRLKSQAKEQHQRLRQWTQQRRLLSTNLDTLSRTLHSA